MCLTEPLLLAVIILSLGGGIVVGLWRIARSDHDAQKSRAGAKALYSFDHSILNLDFPPRSMWMNMGFWKETNDFPTACQSLLEEVLVAAGLLKRSAATSPMPPQEDKRTATVSIVDLGFGCGDQCLYIRNAIEHLNGHPRWKRAIRAYVGITLEESHVRITKERLGTASNSLGVTSLFQVHCADAGKPTTWESKLLDSVAMACQAESWNQDNEVWLLGLDALIHFRPSRWPIIEFGCRGLDASFMAYDLCISEKVTIWQRAVLMLMALVGHSPLSNWVTMAEYRQRLVSAGYSCDNIEIRDVSEHVFGPLASFLQRKETQVAEFGLSIGRFRYAAKMFNWWRRTGVVKGCIIIAKK